jgi:RHS repeat-associated protein
VSHSAPFGHADVTGSPDANAFRSTGREDDGTGLYYYRARYYDPTRSRFVSQDPIGLAGGVNGYAYGANSPTNWIDPQGTWIIPAAAIAVSASVPVLVLYLINKCMDSCRQGNPCDDLEDPSRGANIKKCLDRCTFGLEFLGWHSPKGSAVKAGSKAGQTIGRAVSGE